MASRVGKSGSVHVSVSGRGFTGTYITEGDMLTVTCGGRNATVKLGLLPPELRACEVLRNLVEKRQGRSAKG